MVDKGSARQPWPVSQVGFLSGDLRDCSLGLSFVTFVLPAPLVVLGVLDPLTHTQYYTHLNLQKPFSSKISASEKSLAL